MFVSGGYIMPISRYVDTQETIQISSLYRSGAYSMQDLADQKHLSKATVVNVLKGYPYTSKDLQSDVLQRLQDKLIEIQNKVNQSPDCLSGYQFQLMWLVCLFLYSFTQYQDAYQIIKKHRLWHEQQAWKSFADGKMSEFGYHADAWEDLTDVVGDNLRNPWRCIAYKHNARGKACNVKYDCVVSG
jgi:hypothetical protein